VPTVTFRVARDAAPIIVDVEPGTTLFDVGAKVGAGIPTACVGKGTCGLCRVKVIAGATRLSPYGDEEKKHLGNVFHLTGIRLACRAQVLGDVEVALLPPRVRR
jgi:2Fe-2S ferredoxin